MRKLIFTLCTLLSTLIFTANAIAETAAPDTACSWYHDPLQTVVVTATRTPKALKDIPVVTRVISAQEIRQADATDIKDLLQQQLPGLEFSWSMGQQVMNMGGYDGNNILFLVDGERLAGESMDNVDFSRINLQNVARIEIVKGAASTLYGSSAMGGVVNIITRQPSDTWSANVNSRYEGATREWRHGASGEFNAGRVNSLTTMQMTDAKALHLDGEVSSIGTAYANSSRSVKERITVRATDDVKITGRAGYFYRERRKSNSQHERYRDADGGVRANWNIGHDQQLEVAYSFDQYDKSDYAVVTRQDVRDYSNRQNIGRALYNLAWSDARSQITVGGDVMNDYLLSYQFADSRKHRTQNTLDGFVQWDYAPDERWDIIGGLRYDYFSASDKGQPTWKVAAMRKFDNQSLRASYASGFREPSLKELYMDFNMAGIFMIYGNPDLKCEKNHNFSATWEGHKDIGQDLRMNATVTGYFNMFDNYITTTTVQRDGEYGQMYTNVADQKIAGADANVQVSHSCGLSGKVSYAWTESIVGKGQPDLTSARPHSLTWRIDYGHLFSENYGLHVALSGRAMSDVDVKEYTSMQLDEMTTTHYAGYSIWKLSVSQCLWQGVTVNAAVDNLFGYRPRNYYANSAMTKGTTVTVGVSLDLEKLF